MTQNKGYKLDFRTVISEIKNNLEDRYPPESIFKEFLQNADDAKATHLEIGWSPGLIGAEHPLLQGPGIFIINNGSFSTQDDEAIQKFGISNKPTDRHASGTFGLGMKSIFYLCEAFFYLSSTPREASHDSVTKETICDILNPWYEIEEDWNIFSGPDQSLMREHLNPLFFEGKYFVLWLPLRKASHCRIKDSNTPRNLHSVNHGDVEGFPYGLKTRPALFADQLPLIRYVQKIRLWDHWKSLELPPSFEIHFPQGGPRCQFPSRTSSNANPTGIITVEEDKGSLKLHYAIKEHWLPELDSFREKPGWPTSMSLKSFNQEKDKNEPHSAISLSCWPSKSPGKLWITRAVFLPLRGETKDYPKRNGMAKPSRN